MAVPSLGQECPKCGTEANTLDRFCARCGSDLHVSKCTKCGHPLQRDANFCEGCGAPVLPPGKKPEATAVDNVIAALDMALREGDPKRALQASMDCLNKQPSAEQAAVASVVTMSSYARLGNFNEAQAHLIKARGFYADHLALPDHQRAEYIQGGHLIGDLQAAGSRDLQENPWLYFILGHAYGPMLPEAYRGDTEAEKRITALRHWADFIKDNHEEMFGALAYLYFSNCQYSEAAKPLEKILLMARKYESVDPIRIEVLWPRVVLGDCYWSDGQHHKAAACWRGAHSFDVCVQFEPDLDSWSQFALPWIEKAKSRLAEHSISVPAPEVSRQASEHLKKAVEHLLEAEAFEAGGVDLEELSALIRRAGRRYTGPIDRAASELEIVERADEFTWAKVPIKDSASWFRYESANAALFHKIALVHIANQKLALAIASFKQAMDVWPTLLYGGLIGGLQATCGLVADAKATYEMCIDRIEELGATESSDGREDFLRELRQALRELPR
jgi:tetratricopeptide (TPR) repeat protein